MLRSGLLRLIVVLSLNSAAANCCADRNYGYGSIVCVCNSTYCDDIGKVVAAPLGKFLVYTSTKSGSRFDKQTKNLCSCKPNIIAPEVLVCDVVTKFSIDLNNLRQTILGFGGSFTDSSGININSLSNKTKTRLMESYFGPTGIEYTLGRIPMAATDFSTAFYTYQDDQNVTFKLADEDFLYKIPLVHIANSISRKEIRYFSAPWAAPPWMKDGNIINTTFYPQWAEYFTNFISAYKANNVTIWAVSSQNEPFTPFFIPINIPQIYQVFTVYSSLQLETFMIENLRPTLKSAYPDVKLLAFDDNSPLLPVWQLQFVYNLNFCNSIDGTAIHWYDNNYINYNKTFSAPQNSCANKFIVSTEACITGQNPRVQLGKWENAESYAYDIIKDLQNWVAGWVDWNMALNPAGGPNWLSNFVDSPIIVNSTEDVFLKQPMYYALGHFSKFIPPGFRVANIPTRTLDEEIEVLAAVKPQNYSLKDVDYDVAVVVLNKGNATKYVELEVLGGQSSDICAEVPARAIQTYVWKLN